LLLGDAANAWLGTRGRRCAPSTHACKQASRQGQQHEQQLDHHHHRRRHRHHQPTNTTITIRDREQPNIYAHPLHATLCESIDARSVRWKGGTEGKVSRNFWYQDVQILMDASHRRVNAGHGCTHASMIAYLPPLGLLANS
jgi:hypothetical protein